MGTHLRVLSESYPKNTNITGNIGFQTSLHPCALGKGSLNIWRVNILWCKNPWYMGTHLRVLSESYPMNTNITGNNGFQTSLHPCALGKGSVSFGRVKACKRWESCQRFRLYQTHIWVRTGHWLSVVPLRLKDPVKHFEKRREFLPDYGNDLTLAVWGSVQPNNHINNGCTRKQDR